MNDLVAYFYSEGDLVMLMAKVFSWLVLTMFITLVFGVIRGLMP